jgi:hypothetical protein
MKAIATGIMDRRIQPKIVGNWHTVTIAGEAR